MSDQLHKTAFGEFHLNRHPNNHDKSLRAWDSADDYILNQIKNIKLNIEDHLMIFNDSFGALALALHKYTPTLIGDSYLSELATIKNFENNSIDKVNYNFHNPLNIPNKNIDLLIIKVPKSLDFLFDFLGRISHSLHSNCQILIAGMQKNLPRTLWNYLENNFTNITTLPAIKKAKFISASFVKPIKATAYPTHFMLSGYDYRIYNHSNVFSKKSLDIGTRFLINNIPEMKQPESIVDLGCGNGVVGLVFTKIFDQADIHFVDESYLAIDSAKLTLEANNQISDRINYHINHGLINWKPDSVELVVCNPPFHQNQTIGTHIANDMFIQAHRALKKGGHFLVVANRHLPYYPKLKRRFNKVKTIASDKKFNLYLATK